MTIAIIGDLDPRFRLARTSAVYGYSMTSWSCPVSSGRAGQSIEELHYYCKCINASDPTEGSWNALLWRHNEHDSVSNHQPRGCLLERLFRRRSKKTSKAPRHWPLCGEFTGTGEFPAQRASYAENVSIWWRHHGKYHWLHCKLWKWQIPCSEREDLHQKRGIPFQWQGQ